MRGEGGFQPGEGWARNFAQAAEEGVAGACGIRCRRRAGRLALLLFAGALFSGCSRKDPAGAKSGRGGEGMPVPVLVGKAVEKNMPVQISAIGNVQPFTKVAVRSQITGQLARVRFQEGSDVMKGEQLFTIDPRPAEAALEQTKANLARDEAQLENARIEFARAQKLYESNISSRDDYDKAQANLDTLRGTVLADRAAISNAALNLEYTSIHSPIDGRAGNVLVHEGNIVKAEDDVLLQINQVHPIFITFAVPEQFLPEIRRRMRDGPLKARANFVNLDGPPPQGNVVFIDNAVDPTTGTIQLKATFDNPDNTLWPGQFVQVIVTLSEQANAVVVPTPAIQAGQNGDFVFVVGADQKVEMRPVIAGAARDGQTVVQSGVKPGETVVIDGQLRLVPGARVEAKPANTPDATAQAQEQ
ncbi:MAG TPA: efflux RND transporter periplasmic adaptor subunit [Haliangiales bacterium]|nr:efflux RND transporter periplasmic adaptor subunit [Haliangiales bacterium]